MGACSFMEIGYGKTYKDAYNELVSQAEYEHGHNPYSGTIATTYSCKCNNSLCDAKYAKLNREKNNSKLEKVAYEIAYKRLDDLEKRDCEVIDLGKVSNRVTHHNGWHKFLFYGWAAE